MSDREEEIELDGEGRIIELEENTKAMLTLMQQEDGNSFGQKAEMFYQKKLELVKKVEDFQRLYHSAVEYCNQLTYRPSLSSTSTQQLENFHGVEKVTQLESSDSNPESGVEDPELETNARNAIRETADGFGPDATEEMSSEISGRMMLVENQQTVMAEKGVQRRNGFSFSANTVECSSDTFHSLEQRISCSEQMLGLIEENWTHLNELTRRNEEKREANRELWSQIEKLMKENHVLQEQHGKLMDENGALHMKIQKLMSSNHSSAKNKHNTSQFSRLKTLILSAFRAGGLP
ncbi:protein NETWORKED 3A-like [Cocos nucifera]|uniref:Protein NETWORKED 3A-like n=1 Tax=Cocos nucifera TaxID=13894 RepID=A0A8K0I0B5_COCNU|nr:protein NETWORKED 3A-like [Cocos nucifera]